ncbi:glutamate receptor ionotropic, kainate 2 [Maniola hyperantus]|uniref:glutamate receptor ionotropic, kainate 2 n=1 Tax=Aphantopus hyperantus TaxID=2795564 RepID=UPI001568B6DB|nr:glutamate receptor ionotropic, kainate 2 [Maniola hyperantus]
MELHVLFLLILLINLGCVVSELSLRFVIITEIHEVELPQQIGRAMKVAEDKTPGTTVSDDVILLDRQNEEESYRKLCSAISKGVSLIIDLSWSPWEAAEELSSSAGIPLVRTVLGSQQMVGAFNSYLESRNATDAAILLENESDVDQTLYEVLGRSHIRVWVHAGFTKDTANALKSMRPEPSFYVIIGDSAFVANTYKRAVKEKLVKRNYRWNLILTDYESLDFSMLFLPTVILQADPVECCKLLNLKEECSSTLNGQKKQYILNNLMQYSVDVLTKINADLVKIDCANPAGEMNATKERFYQVLEEDSTNNDSLFFWDEKRSSLLLRSRFILSTYKEVEGLQRAAYWYANEEYKLLPGVVLEPLRNFFRIGTSPGVPWTMVKYDPDTGEPLMTEDGDPIYEGYCIDLIDKIAETMGFDYEIVTPKSGSFGRRLPNGSWDGIVGDLTTGETDIAVAALTMTAEREEVVDFVAPYFEQTGILIAIRKPIRKTSLFKFMTVLRTEVWLSIVAALLLTGFMIWLLEKYSPYSARNNPDAYPYPCREFTLKESFWFALTSFTPQGGGEAPKALSGRTLVAAYWLFVVLMLATFTANLAAFLTVERMQTPVASLEQLARQSRINYTVVEGSTIHQYFINMKFAEDTLYRVWKEITLNATSDQSQYRVWDYPIREQYGHILLAINASGPVADAETGFQQVNEHSEADFAFIHDSAEIKYEITRNCNLTEVGEVFAEQPYAIAVQQGSRLQEDLSKTLLDLQKERFLELLSSKYWNETARQACPDSDESEGITLESLGGVFIATLFGLGLAMITLAWEVFYYKRKEKNKVQALDATIEKTEAFVEKKKENLPSKDAEGVAKVRKRKKASGNIVKTVTIGDQFKPADKGISYISVYPKDGYRP